MRAPRNPRPLVGSLAMRLNNLREQGKAAEAAALLEAHNRLRALGGEGPYDESADWTDCPMEGLVTCPAEAAQEALLDLTVQSLGGGAYRVAA